MRLAICGQFFLDREIWQELRRTVIPQLLDRGGSLSVWSAGCHVGKEPFSVAMLLDELAPDRAYAIVASDRDPSMLERARAGGPFHGRDMDELTPGQIERYFAPGGPPFFVLPEYVRRVAFVQHDVRGAALVSDADLILFRNVEPFFGRDVTRPIHRRLCTALRPGGILFVGDSESVQEPDACGVEAIGRCLYRRKQALPWSTT